MALSPRWVMGATVRLQFRGACRFDEHHRFSSGGLARFHTHSRGRPVKALAGLADEKKPVGWRARSNLGHEFNLLEIALEN